MKKVYIKNYKGFSEEIIELLDINFLVGENSTGKTAILKLINILSSPSFWMNSEFNSKDIELGFFDEILNKESEESTFFIGMEKPIDKKGELKRILFEFKSSENIPVINRIKTNVGGKDLLVEIHNTYISYSLKNQIKQDFRKWCNDLTFTSARKRITGIHKKLPFTLLIGLIEDGMVNKNNVDANKLPTRLKAYPLMERYLWMAPIRAKPKRIYEGYELHYSAEGDHIPMLLRKLLNKKRSIDNKSIISVLESFGKESKLFDAIKIEELGGKNSSAFRINISYGGTSVKLPNVGYGISQSLPLIIEILSSKAEQFSIQQPEVHLHPKAQAAFGSFIFNSFITNRNQFIIETHSDFTINRFRYELLKANDKKKNTSKLPQCQVLFFERDKSGTKFTVLKLGDNGEYVGDVPPAYREFFIDEELKLLEL